MNVLRNIVSNALRPGYAVEMARKLGRRLTGSGGSGESPAITAWCDSQATSIEGWADAVDHSLWLAATSFAERQREYADRLLRDLEIDLGGGGAYGLLYFLTRFLRPMTIVESGVAAGFSSRAFLTALGENGQGKLHSSDFPYFRIQNPERYVGYIVEPELRDGWDLLVRGDHKNFPLIAQKIGTIDLLHYDSDKSYAGREFALKSLSARLSSQSLIIFDDIQDNWHFRDYVRDKEHWRVFPFEGKWLGMWGGPRSLYLPVRS